MLFVVAFSHPRLTVGEFRVQGWRVEGLACTGLLTLPGDSGAAERRVQLELPMQSGASVP